MLEIHGVSKYYEDADSRRRIPALSNLNLRVNEGEFVCLLGTSGCGKSTLLNLIAGFIKPSLGRLFFQNRPITGPGQERGVVFQESTLFPWLTVLQNVEFGLKNKGVSKNARRLKALQSLEQVGLKAYRDARPHSLSGGMRQRVALARVWVLEPPLLLMDEPFSALDENIRERLQDELIRLWQAETKTIVFVTHNVNEAAYLADRVVILKAPPQSLVAQVTISLSRPRSRSCGGNYCGCHRIVSGLRTKGDAGVGLENPS